MIRLNLARHKMQVVQFLTIRNEQKPYQPGWENIPLAQVRCWEPRMSAGWGRTNIEHSLVQVCFSPIVLKSPFLIEFSGPLVRFTRYDVGEYRLAQKRP